MVKGIQSEAIENIDEITGQLAGHRAGRDESGQPGRRMTGLRVRSGDAARARYTIPSATTM
jgi:hypothetical protein